MKKVVLVVVLAMTAATLAAPALSRDQADSGFSASLGLLSLMDSDARDTAGTGFGLEVRKQVLEGLGSLPDVKLHASIGYVGFSNTWRGVDVRETVVPVMATAIREQPQSGFYYGAGLGLAFTHASASGISENKTNFAFQLLGGKNFDKFFAEARYFNGGIAGNTGLGLSVGGRF